MKIADLAENTEYNRKIAVILRDAFRLSGSTDWKVDAECLREVEESISENKISRIGFNEAGEPVAWAVGEPLYKNFGWELSILVVAPHHQKLGYGQLMLKDFESCVISSGGSAVLVGCDDENSRSSLGGIDLYPNPLEKLAQMQNQNNHPFSFYENSGYEIVGVFPDANGFGKPDIFLAKTLLKFNIREAKPDESEDLTIIAKRAKAHWNYSKELMRDWEEELTITPEFIENNNVFVAEINDEKVGLCSISLASESAELVHLWVSPRRIGSGIGKKLFSFAVAFASDHGKKSLTIESDPNAKGFYQKMGAFQTNVNIVEYPSEVRHLPIFTYRIKND